MTKTKLVYGLSKKSLMVIACLLLIAGILSIYYSSFNNISSEVNTDIDIRQWTISMVNKVQFHDSAQFSVINIILIFGFLSLATSLGLPRQIAALVAGINLGAAIGAIVATLAVTLGCWLTFTLSRYALSHKIKIKYPDKIKALSDFIGEKTFLKTIVIRLLPIGSNFLTNIVAGVSAVSMKAYVGGSFFGFIPQMVIFSLAGSGIRLGAQSELIASGVLFLIALLLTAYLVKTHRRKIP
jgi:uncharacterized membrane protein YdjX (TVP38/TMEM64 family)